MKKRTKLYTRMVILIVIALALTIPGGNLFAKKYPHKPIRMIYPFPAGSGGDIVTRILADGLSKELGVPVKVSNITGGKATIGAAKVAKARTDGYEIGSLPIGPAVTQPIFSKKLPYKTADFEPICMYTYLPIVLVSSSKAPFSSTAGLIEYARKNPGKLKYGHPGLGTVPYMMIAALKDATGIKMKGLPFKGMRPSVTSTVGGHVDIALSVAAAAEGFQKAGKLNILGVFSNQRLQQFPEVPTLDESGVKSYPMLWTGIFVPKGTDKNVRDTLGASIAKIVNSNAFEKAMNKAKMPILYLDRDDFKKKIDSDIAYFKAYKANMK